MSTVLSLFLVARLCSLGLVFKFLLVSPRSEWQKLEQNKNWRSFLDKMILNHGEIFSVLTYHLLFFDLYRSACLSNTDSVKKPMELRLRQN